MITITDSAGHSLTLDDVEMTSAEFERGIDDFRDERRHAPESGSITVRVPRAPNDLLSVLNGASVHAPAPTSARWEGPPPKRRGRR